MWTEGAGNGWRGREGREGGWGGMDLIVNECD